MHIELGFGTYGITLSSCEEHLGFAVHTRDGSEILETWNQPHTGCVSCFEFTTRMALLAPRRVKAHYENLLLGQYRAHLNRDEQDRLRLEFESTRKLTLDGFCQGLREGVYIGKVRPHPDGTRR